MIVSNLNSQADNAGASARPHLCFVSPPSAEGAGIPPYKHVVEYVLNGVRSSLFIASESNPVPTIYMFDNPVASSGALRLLRSATSPQVVTPSEESSEWPTVDTDGPRFVSKTPARYARFRR
jgi:hypothetical protein